MFNVMFSKKGLGLAPPKVAYIILNIDYNIQRTYVMVQILTGPGSIKNKQLGLAVRISNLDCLLVKVSQGITL